MSRWSHLLTRVSWMAFEFAPRGERTLLTSSITRRDGRVGRGEAGRMGVFICKGNPGRRTRKGKRCLVPRFLAIALQRQFNVHCGGPGSLRRRASGGRRRNGSNLALLYTSEPIIASTSLRRPLRFDLILVVSRSQVNSRLLPTPSEKQTHQHFCFGYPQFTIYL